VSVKLYDAVRFKDVIETKRGSQAKALFYDDSLLTVGEHSRIEITEHLFDPARNKRCLVVKLLWGAVRVLVGKEFTGSGSKFEIHTPSGVAAARGTYFVVWADQRSSGVVNIGDHGSVDFTAEGLTVGLGPHQFSFSRTRSLPTRPTAVSAGAPTGARKAVEETEANAHLKPQPILAVSPVTVRTSSGRPRLSSGALTTAEASGVRGTHLRVHQ
ncbi:MAG: FecR domain-containing protein, partial [Nitrospiraceae bacterium]